MSGQSQKRQHHVFVIALEENVLGWSLAEFDQGLDNLAGGGAAIDIIADEYYRIATHRRDRGDHSAHLVNTAVNIADSEQSAGGRAFALSNFRSKCALHRQRLTPGARRSDRTSTRKSS